MADAEKQKKKREKKERSLTRRSFGRNVAGSVVLLGVTAGVYVAADKFSSFLDHYLGSGTATVSVVEGSEDWDTTYYDQQYDALEDSTAAANELVVELASEGIVLMKNDNAALPLAGTETISLLGRFAADCVYGGTGSGQVDSSAATTLYQGIADAGFAMNDTTYDFIEANYDSYDKGSISMTGGSSSYYIGEIPWEDYSSEAQDSIAGTVGVVVIGRPGGEGGDLCSDLLSAVGSGEESGTDGDSNVGSTYAFAANSETANYVEGQHQLELTVEELGVIAAAKASCDKVIVIINASTTIELGLLTSGDYEVDAILEVGSYGTTGAAAVGKVLTGEVNPSGRTCDLWAADFTASPVFGNFGGHQYTDVTDHYDDTAYFTEYKEGIYFGYRYHETAYAEAQAGNYDGYDYDEQVVFPFGYGLSYTTFESTLDSVGIEDDAVNVTVTVTNTGDVAGKDVVEVYYTAPYTEGGVEKAAVVLGAFAKTSELAAGASETVELSYPVKYMSSWDSSVGHYVLDAGDYVISLRENSHDVIAEETLTLSATDYTEDEATGTVYENQFADMTEYMESNYTPFSRADFAGTWPTTAADTTTDAVGLVLEEYDVTDHLNDDDEMPTTGADNGLSLVDMRGLDYDDEQWDLLLDELTVDDMTTMLADCAYNTPAIESISKPATAEPDGPAGFTSLFGSTGNCAYCSEYLMAQTWNVDALYQMGLMVGQEALTCGYNGWYAPAMNTHRSPFAGRNFEYYSEDPLLAGKLSSACVTGCAENGVYAMLKHFCLNDQETYRDDHLCTWANEQAVREIYMRPFEITVKESVYEEKYISDAEGTLSTRVAPACTGIMSSFNYVGATWAGGRKSMLTNVLRDEWGFTGCVITDFNLANYMVYSQALEAGTELELTYSIMKDYLFQETDHPTVVQELRQASHRVLYTIANSNAMQGMAPGSIITYSTAPWQYAVWALEGVLVAGAAYFGYRAYTAHKAKKDAAAKVEA